MIYTESELKKKIYKMIEEFESEVVELRRQRAIIHLMILEDIFLLWGMRQI